MAITSSYPPDIFQLVLMTELSKRHFDLHPIWSELYDFEEREEIVSWGVDREWLEREIERVQTGNVHCAYPILRPYPLPHRMRLYVKARFVTAGGTKLDGFVMNNNAFVVKLFAGAGQYWFSRNTDLSDFNDQSLRELKETIAQPDDPIFPLRYETDFLGHDGALIAGSYSAGVKAKGVI